MNHDNEKELVVPAPIARPAPHLPPPRLGARVQALARLRELARVAAAFDRVATGDIQADPRARLAALGAAPVRREAWSDEGRVAVEALLATLDLHQVTLVRRRELEGPCRAEAQARFARDLFPTLTPLTVDAGHPLPRARLHGILCVAELSGGPNAGYALVPMPVSVGRWVRLASAPGTWRFAAVEDLVRIGLSGMFGRDLAGVHVVRVLHAADRTPRLVEHGPDFPAALRERLRAALRLGPEALSPTRAFLGIADFAALCDEVERA
ncbi:MAG: hypothetical protein ACK4YP_18880 [Myxococcota bacterium]